MSAKQLNEIANYKGIQIGRMGSKKYRYGFFHGNMYKEFIFLGSFNSFAAFIQNEVAPSIYSRCFQEISVLQQ